MEKKPTAFISKIVFSGGQEFTFQRGDKVIIVGPNNSGKSQTLREIKRIASDGVSAHNVVLNSIEIQKDGTAEELKDFLDRNASRVEGHFHYKNWQVFENHIRSWNLPFLRHSLIGGFLKNIDAESRLLICRLQESISDTDPRTAPQHLLYDDTQLMEKISGLFRQAFGYDLMINYRGGKFIPIHVGRLPSIDTVDRISNDYVAEVKKNPLLNNQGDGVKSYAGILFEAVAAGLDITLIDEPEAFLHPPQMRHIGQTLAQEVKSQLFVATHSSHVMHGFLEGAKGSVRILRIKREDAINVVSEADPEIVNKLWRIPVLRYSNALEAVFHEQAILCEDHSDCRLFNAVADYISEEKSQRWLDTAYIPTGGKQSIPAIANVLRKIGIPTKAVFDIDILRDETEFKVAVEAFGGDYEIIHRLWKQVDRAVSDGVRRKSNQEIKENIKKIIDESDHGFLPKNDIYNEIKMASPWNYLKRVGRTGLPSGEIQDVYDRLINELEMIGIYVVSVGEVENFCRKIGLHGPKFVNKLLSEISLGDESLKELRSFVEKFHGTVASK